MPLRGLRDGEDGQMITLAQEPDPCGWEDVYRAYGCPVEFDDELDDDD